MNRRKFLAGLLATVAAPPLIRPGRLEVVMFESPEFERYTSYFSWHSTVINDWRYVVRVCDIDKIEESIPHRLVAA